MKERTALKRECSVSKLAKILGIDLIGPNLTKIDIRGEAEEEVEEWYRSQTEICERIKPKPKEYENIIEEIDNRKGQLINYIEEEFDMYEIYE